ncbi:MAG: hypothetical protein PUD93_09945 [Lachnospiraceae bacterium]|nr:hypothetical protein [Lachnospiraceae bacterium]
MSTIDKKTFEKLIHEYTPNMYRLAYGILHNREDADNGQWSKNHGDSATVTAVVGPLKHKSSMREE